jgi:uncharacterized spore protein YtfJ
MNRRRTLLVVAVVLMLGLAGCSGMGGSDGVQSGNGDGAEQAADAGGNGNGAGGSGEASVQPLQAQQRQVIKTGEVRLRVNDTERASQSVQDLAAERGGFVSARNREANERYNETWETERIVIRVPGEEFEATVAEIETLGEVRSVETNTEDVTEQLVDIEARLENLRAERDRLRELYDEANETEDVLAVQRELADVQEEIERLEARKKALERDVAYSTITVHLAEEPPESPEPEPEAAWYDTGLVAAFLESVSGVTTTLRAMAVATAYLAPYLIVFGTPVVGIVAYQRYRGE